MLPQESELQMGISRERPLQWFRQEVRRNEALGMYAVNGFWGDKRLALQLTREVNALKRKDDPTGDDIYPSGFEEIYRSSPELFDDEAKQQEIDAVTNNIRFLLRVNDWDPNSIEAFSFGCGSPVVDRYGEFIADQVGIRNAAVFDTVAACNSSGRALQRVLETGEFDHRRTLVVGAEGMTRLARNLDLSLYDPFSLTVFGNGTSAVSLIPGESVHYVNGTTKYKEDKGNLAAKVVYPIDPNGTLLQVDGNIERLRLPVPDGGRLIDMKQKGTARMFAEFGLDITSDTLKQYNDRRGSYPTDTSSIWAVASHHPSYGMSQILERTLKRHGITFSHWPWVVSEGNLSSTTSQVAFTRIMEDWKLGTMEDPQDMYYLSFGAGESGTGMILRAGMTEGNK